MTREDFYHSVQENIKAMLPQDFLAYEVNLRKMDVSYGEYMGLTIGMFGESVEPVFNLDQMYQSLSECPMSEALQKTADVITEYYRKMPEHIEVVKNRCFDILSSFEKAKPYMFAATCPMNNLKFLETTPHRMMDDIALLAKIDMIPDDSHSSISVTVRNDTLEKWGVSADEVMDQALENTKLLRPGKLKSIAAVLAEELEMSNALPLQPMDSVPPILVYTNEKRLDGLAGIFSDGVMQDIYERLQDDFYVLPSSIHEALIYPESGKRTYEDAKIFSDMVKNVNETEVSDDEVVSDYAYHYDHTADKFEKAYDFVKRLENERRKDQDMLPENVTMAMQMGGMEKQLI